MPAVFIYLLKLSVSLAVVFLFYQLVLRRLTFYNWNRWYLLGYSLLCFLIPFIDITPTLHQNELTNSTMVQWIPVFYKTSSTTNSVSLWNVLSLLIVIGMLIMAVRLVIQLFSFRQMMRKAQLIDNNAINLYQVNESIIPFSFGNAVFINRHLHTEKELEEIIRHEFVHVKQHHSIDIIFSEILCLFNWFNPFAWLLRSAIRQNLEFVADNQVLENGVDKKQYQYLLLKVIGNDQFSIAQKFNFSSLKKRIAMMNKNKSAKMHLLRFLFLLPVLAVILVSFRKEIGDTLIGKQKKGNVLPAPVIDTLPEITQPNSKGYIINVKDKKGECLLVIKNKSGVEVKRLLLTEWNKDADTYEAKYGEIPPPLPPRPPAPPTPVKMPDNVQSITINDDNAIVILKNGEIENYDWNKPEQQSKFQKKYGKLVPPPPPPPPPAPPTKADKKPSVNIQFNGNVDNVDASLNGPGNPYSRSSITIKGNTEDVIYILDGVEITKAEMDKIKPDVIESVDVLKGNSAIELHGEKARNGVIIIKSKNKDKAKPTTHSPFLFPGVKNNGC